MDTSFSFTLKVNSADIDHLNHVNNVVYVNWVLEAAAKHWNTLSSNEMNEAYVWVVLRHEIDYLGAAILNDEITVTTWIGDSYGVKSDRFIEFKRGEKLLAKAKTVWCLLDRKTMRPVRIPLNLLEILK